MANVEARGCSAKLWDPGSPGWQWGTAVGLFYSLSIPWHTRSVFLGAWVFSIYLPSHLFSFMSLRSADDA